MSFPRPPLRPRIRWPWLAVAVWLAVAPQPARAWTRTHVSDARAHLDVLPDGTLRVVLRLGLAVRGGWISRFEIRGLESDLSLDPDKPVWLVARDAQGRKYSPHAHVTRRGHLVVEFDRRSEAPWRGDYELGLVYTTRQPLEQADQLADGQLGLSWQLPPWERSLHDVHVQVAGPRALRAIDDASLQHSVEVKAARVPGRAVLDYHRVQLPRSTPWRVSFSAPAPATTRAAAPEPPAPSSSTNLPVPSGLHALLGVLLGSLALLKLASARRLARARQAVALPLLPLPAAARIGLIAVGTVVGAHAMSGHPDAGLACWLAVVGVALHRGFEPAPRPLLQGPGPRLPQRAALARARVLGWLELCGFHAWLDATTPPGACLLAAGVLLGATLAWHDPRQALGWMTCLCLMPLFFDATRLHLPASGATRLQRLAKLRRRIGKDLGAELVLHADPALRAPALQITPAWPCDGLAGLRVTLHSRRWLGRSRSVPVLEVDAEAGSPVAARLQQALPHARVHSSDPAVLRWEQPTGSPRDDLRSVLDWLRAADDPQIARRAA